VTVTILVGDVREKLAQLADASVQCVVTSPPYFGLRSYLPDGHDDKHREIGSEPTLAEYIATMVEVFRGVKRVLHPTGVCFLNLGDSYSGMYSGRNDAGKDIGGRGGNREGSGNPGGGRSLGIAQGFKPKDLMMVPARLAIALQDAGWWLRSDIIWHKPNPMPESVQDRPSTAHEHIFLLTKSDRYFYDAAAVKTEAKAPTTKMPDGWDTGAGAHGSFHRNGREAGARTDKQRGHGRRHDGFNDRGDALSKDEQQANGANLRNVWTIATHPFPGAHFATFPPEIPRRCIKAGTKPGDTVLDPFGGAGTVGLVADELGRDAILIELNPEYARLAQDRIVSASPMFADVVVEAA